MVAEQDQNHSVTLVILCLVKTFVEPKTIKGVVSKEFEVLRRWGSRPK